MAAACERRSREKREPVDEIDTRPLHVVKNATTKQGRSGRKVVLKANYFKLVSQTDWCLYQYAVEIAPEEKRTIVRKALLRTHKNALGAYLFDGTTLYTSNRLPQPLELNSIRNEDKVPMNIKIKLVGDLMKGDYHYFQFFNILMRKCLENLQLQLVGRNYYDAASRIEIVDYQLQLWPGYFTSIRQHDGGVMMCAEITHKVMRDQTLLSILNECIQTNRREYQNVFKATVMGTVVLTAYNNRTYKIDDVDFSVNPSRTFMRNDKEITYAAYYKEKYQINIRDLNQPLLVSVSSARDRRAGSSELIYLIPELCRSTGLTDKMRNDFKLMRALSQHTRIDPGLRIERLLKFNQRLMSKPEIVEDFNKWNFKLSKEIVEFEGRVLPAEPILFGIKAAGGAKKYTVEVPKNCDWNFKLQENPQLRAATFDDWVVIAPQRSGNETKNFIKALIVAAKKISISMAQPRLEMIRDDRLDSYCEALSTVTDRVNPKMILCIVPNNQQQRYNAIKKKLCIDRPIPSQVVLFKNLVKKSASMMNAVCCKVAVQMNCKVGGLPWTVDIASKIPGLMVVGFDVCHDKKGDFGAMVASLDQNFGRYFSAVSQHSSGEELSNDLSLNLGRAITEFRKHNNNRVPSKIIIYRDGVGEGQIPFVHSYEVEQVKKTLAQVYQGCKDPFKLAFIIVTKRINTRIFANKNNPEPGTVIDQVITDPLKYDFFIVSQHVKQGTVAPTAYNVIDDNTGIECDKMQWLTFKFCHMYYNFSGTVRVPAPCQYAHKLAFFISQTLRQAPNPALTNLLYFL